MRHDANLSDQAREWALGSTFHALPNIVRTDKRVLKTIWTLSLVLSLGFCCYMVIQNVCDFFDFGVVTHVKSISELPATFPAVTFCNANPFVTKASLEVVSRYLERLNVSSIEEAHFEGLNVEDYFSPLGESIYYLKSTVRKLVDLELSDEEKKKLSLPVERIFINCFFNFKQCNLSNLLWYYDVYYGNCYTFNSGFNSKGERIPLETTSNFGDYNGLEVDLFIGMVDDVRTISTETGAHIFIHNHTDRPHSSSGIDALPGYRTYIQVSRTFREILPYPHNNCENKFDSSPYYQCIKDSPYIYRQQDCFFYIYQQRLMNQCHCYDQSYPKIDETSPPCLLVNQTLCLYDVYMTIFDGNSKYQDTEICPLECSSSLLALSVTYRDWPSKSHADMLANTSQMRARFALISDEKPTGELVKKKIAAFNVYYQDLNYIYIKERENVTFLDLLSSIGGTLGLFLGVSLLSIIELFEIAFNILYALYHERKTRIQAPTKKAATAHSPK